MSRVSILQSADLFSSLGEEALEALACELEERSFAAGDKVVAQGDAGEEMFLIASGVAEAFTEAEGGEFPLVKMEAGEFFGEIALLTGGNRSASVRAVTALEVLVLGQEGFFRFLSSTREVQQAFATSALERKERSAKQEAEIVDNRVSAADVVLEKLIRFEIRALRQFEKPGAMPDFDEVWDFYKRARFLYPAKLENLAPYAEEIRRTWTGLLEANNGIFKFVLKKEPEGNANLVSASVCGFEYAPGTWQIQHLVSASRQGLLGSLTVLLAMNRWLSANDEVSFVRLTYRPANAGVKELFGSCFANAGKDTSCMEQFEYFVVPTAAVEAWADGAGNAVQVRIAERDSGGLVEEFYREHVHAVAGESLRLGDPNLDALNGKYTKAGLERGRAVILAAGNGGIEGVLLANFGSAGMNFSFLENEVTGIKVRDSAGAEQRDGIVRAMIGEAAGLYRERGRDFMVFMVEAPEAEVLARAGLVERPGKEYTVFTLGRPDFPSFHRSNIVYYRDLLTKKG